MLRRSSVEEEGDGGCCYGLEVLEGCSGDAVVICVKPCGLCLTVSDVSCVVACMGVSCVYCECLELVCEAIWWVGPRGVGGEVQGLGEVYLACVFALCFAMGGCACYVYDERGWWSPETQGGVGYCCLLAGWACPCDVFCATVSL